MTKASGRRHWWPAYIGLGSNLDSPRDQLASASAALEQLPKTRFVSMSPLYRSVPMGPRDQPDYVNAVAALLTRLTPHELLDALQAIEAAQGRVRDGGRWGPRTLDLDLLVYGRQRLDDARLTVPHPGIAERNFVLWPLQDIAPHLEVPGLTSVRALAKSLDADPASIERLED